VEIHRLNGRTYCLHLQAGRRTKKRVENSAWCCRPKRKYLAYSFALKMEAICSSEISVDVYRSTRHLNPKCRVPSSHPWERELQHNRQERVFHISKLATPVYICIPVCVCNMKREEKKDVKAGIGMMSVCKSISEHRAMMCWGPQEFRRLVYIIHTICTTFRYIKVMWRLDENSFLLL
jgi:hypothetical protein